ncbi:cysteine proteinase [Phellopilus nigrolimitatus]|nr:cysteine proteinase [Phellopilus nigrolimitatus]
MLPPLAQLAAFLESPPYAAQQSAPLLVLLGLPALALLARAHWHALSALAHMVLAALGLGLGLPWSWGTAHARENGDASAGAPAGRHKAKKGRARTRAGQQQALANGAAPHGDKEDEDDDEDADADMHYPGLVNVSGTYCFLNSVLQAMASLSYLPAHIDAIHAKAVELDVPSPVVDALRDMLRALNTPKSAPFALRPIPMINALSQPVPGRRSMLFASREHQDAQELFQLLSECVKDESLAVDREGQRDRGLGGLASPAPDTNNNSGDVAPAGVFDGLTANRRSCVACGYTEAVMHFACASWQLSLPRGAPACALQACLADFVRLELLTDCVCRLCSLRATRARLAQEADRLAGGAGDAPASASRKKRAREARRLEARVAAAIDEGRIEEDIKGVKIEKVLSAASTKQAMIARPPRVLVLHLNRSVHYGGHAGRNACQVIFPEILDLTPYTTSGQLSTQPSVPLSAPPPSPAPAPRAATPTPAAAAAPPRVLYRLDAVVCHYGAHSFGHYVCFRRRPRPAPASSAAAASPSGAGPAFSAVPPPVLACPYGCACAACAAHGPVRDPRPSRAAAAAAAAAPPAPGRGWLRISDAAVEECGAERVLAEGAGAFLLFYERVVAAPPPPATPSPSPAVLSPYANLEHAVYLAGRSPRSSEETVRPADADAGPAGSVDTLSAGASASVGGSGSGVLERPALRPRVVRRATAGRGRPAPPPEKTRSPPPLNGGAAVPAPEDLEGSLIEVGAPLSSSAPPDMPSSPPISASPSTSTSSSSSSASESPLGTPDPSAPLPLRPAHAHARAGAEDENQGAAESPHGAPHAYPDSKPDSQLPKSPDSRLPDSLAPKAALPPPPPPARAPSPTPSAKAAQARIAAPQPTHAHAHAPLQPGAVSV